MIKKIFFLFFFLNIFNYSLASTKIDIINNFKKIDNLSFDFKQVIGDKTEQGKCVIQYPKKIHCNYDNFKKKLIVSNGRSLVIKNQNGKEYFRYLLNQTSLELILNKDLLLRKLEELDGKIIDEKYYIFYLENNGNKINIFFDKSTYDLVGWQTEDIYQNLVITFIYNLVKNSKIDKKLFILPKTH
jgi:outer membrane lipoprotein-sorting protein|tara:strand:+ start:3420 stop:3977 length:558 start_codon:yes stop_codon:yes gene_type:complete